MRRLILVGLFLAGLTGCYKSEWEAAKTENEKLNSENSQLKAEIKKLMETAQYYFQDGQDYFAAKEFDKAIPSFEAVISKFPNDPLVASATKSLAIAQKAQASEIVRKQRAEAAAQRAREQEMALTGEPIDYAVFFAKSHTGLPIGKRYRFDACLATDPPCLYRHSEGQYHTDQGICGLNMDFDDQAEYERWLQTGREYCGNIVASMNWDGTIAIHRLH